MVLLNSELYYSLYPKRAASTDTSAAAPAVGELSWQEDTKSLAYRLDTATISRTLTTTSLGDFDLSTLDSLKLPGGALFSKAGKNGFGLDTASLTTASGILVGKADGTFRAAKVISSDNTIQVANAYGLEGDIDIVVNPNTALPIPDGERGSIVITGGGLTWSIKDGVVSNAKMAGMPTAGFKGAMSVPSGGTANVTDLNPSEACSMLPLFSNTAKGLVPGIGGSPTGSRVLFDNGWGTLPSALDPSLLPRPSTRQPIALAVGDTGSVGISSRYAREDHEHAVDSSIITRKGGVIDQGSLSVTIAASRPEHVITKQYVDDALRIYATRPGPAPWAPITRWLPNTPYTNAAPASLVSYGRGNYVCGTPHTSGPAFDASKWFYVGYAAEQAVQYMEAGLQAMDRAVALAASSGVQAFAAVVNNKLDRMNSLADLASVAQARRNMLLADFDTIAEMATTGVNGVQTNVRFAGYSAAGDGGGQKLVRVSTPSTVKPWHHQSLDGAWWQLVPENGYIDPRQFNAKGDTRRIQKSASITAGQTSLVCPIGTFVSSDVGKSITVPGAGASGGPLSTTVAAFTSSTTITLADAAGTTLTVASSALAIGSDDTAAIQAACDAAVALGCNVFIAPGVYTLTARISVGGAAIQVRGAGMGRTVLMWAAAATSGFLVTQNDYTYTTLFCDMTCLTKGVAAGVAFDVDMSGMAVGGTVNSITNHRLTIRDCEALGASGRTIDGWDWMVRNYDVSSATIARCYCTGVYSGNGYNTLSSGMISSAGADQPVVLNVLDSEAYFVSDGLLSYMTEGGMVHACNFVACRRGVRLTNSDANPVFMISDTHINAYECCVDNTQQSRMELHHCVMFSRPDGNPAVDFVFVRNTLGHYADINHNQFKAFGNYNSWTGVQLVSGDGCEVSHNLFDAAGVTASKYTAISVGASATNATRFGNRYNNVGQVIVDAGTGTRAVDTARLAGAWWVLSSSAVASPHTGDTSEVILASVTVPANILGKNGAILIRTSTSGTSNANSKTIRYRLDGISGTAFRAFAQTTGTGQQDVFIIQNVNATNAQKGSCPAPVTNSFSGKAGGLTTGTVDTTVDKTLVITGQLATSTDTITLESYTVEARYAA